MESNDVLKLFVSVVDGGSFSAAARALNLPVSTVSRQIGRLEARLQVRLLNRTTRQMTLTELGSAYYQSCRRIVADIEDMEARILDRHATPRGRVKVAMPPMTNNQRSIHDPVAAFMKAYPDIALEVEVSTRFVDLVAEGFDVAIRAGNPKDSSLLSRTLLRMKAGLLASTDYLRRHPVSEEIGELRKHDCLVHHSSGAEWPLAAGGSIQVRPRLTSNNIETLRNAMCAGHGIAFLPVDLVRHELERGEVQRIFVDEIGTDAPMSIVYPPGRYRSASVRVFVDFMVTFFKDSLLGDSEQPVL